MTTSIELNNKITQEIKNAGYNTTSINTDKGEASFVDYGAALGDNVKQMIMDSFDCEQDYELQSYVASLFGNHHDLQNGDLGRLLRSAGLNVEVSSVKTQYMVDEKNINASGGFGARKVVNGGITVFKISDGKGGEIVIADSNGNAAIEIEEVFMNQILQGIDGDLQQEIGARFNTGITASSGSGSSGSNFFGDKENEEKISQADFNSKVEQYINLGYSVAESESKVNASLENGTLSYTGTVKDKEQKEKEREPKLSQSKYNKEVEKYLSSGAKINQAESRVDSLFKNAKFSYTGHLKKEDEEKEKLLLNT